MDVRYYESDPDRKYKRLIGQNWFVIKALKPLYVETHFTAKKKESPKQSSSSEGSRLTEKSAGSFSDDFDLANTLRNKERAEMHEIKKYIKAIMKHLVSRAHTRYLKNQAAGIREVFDW